MDQTEKWVQEYLEHRGFKDIVFEPDGNVPPDFLVNGKIAVEARRLNQHYETESGTLEGLEQLSVPLRKKLEALLESFGPPANNVSWYVSYRFKRPQLTRNWETVLRERLRAVQSATVAVGEEVAIKIDRNFSLRLRRKREPGGRGFFLLVGDSDFDGGGWAIPELKKNITFCIDEKTRKIAPYRKTYSEWWLVLVDFMFAGTERPVQVGHDWDKVLVIHPSNYAAAYEVQSVI